MVRDKVENHLLDLGKGDGMKERLLLKPAPMIQRINEICAEFDDRVKEVGLKFARLELAKSLAEAEERAKEKQ